MSRTRVFEWNARSRQTEKGGRGEEQSQNHYFHSFDTKRIAHKEFVLARPNGEFRILLLRFKQTA
jgi:hypothetical protein